MVNVKKCTTCEKQFQSAQELEKHLRYWCNECISFHLTLGHETLLVLFQKILCFLFCKNHYKSNLLSNKCT